MEGRANKMKTNILRGKILAFLRDMYPEGADERSIVSIFYQYHKSVDIIDSLAYLSDKGYVQKKDLPHPYRKLESIKMFKISPTGIDLVEGNIPLDPGIEVLQEDR
jgi:hypothetical protein